MSFSKQSLVRQGVPVPVGSTAGAAQQQSISPFAYATDDAAATVEAAGYFNNARAILKKGDMIDAVMVHSGSVVRKLFVVTAAPASGNVTIAVGSVTAA